MDTNIEKQDTYWHLPKIILSLMKHSNTCNHATDLLINKLKRTLFLSDISAVHG
jgi:hypothetical protein